MTLITQSNFSQTRGTNSLFTTSHLSVFKTIVALIAITPSKFLYRHGSFLMMPRAAGTQRARKYPWNGQHPVEAWTHMKVPWCTLLLICSLLVVLQWQSLIQDLQAEEKHTGGFSPVWATQTCWSDTGQWKPKTGCNVAWRRGSQWVDRCQ